VTRWARDLPGLLFGGAGLWALLAWPFVIEKSSRVVPGIGIDVELAMPVEHWAWWVLLLSTWLIAALSHRPSVRLIAGAIAVGALLHGVGSAATAQTMEENAVMRVAPGAGFWCALAAMLLLVIDAVARWRLSASRRCVLLAVTLCAAAFGLHSGHFDAVSVLREYAVNADRFGHEFNRHLALSLGSVLTAVLLGLPLGILCQGRPAPRQAVLAVLSLVQTIPSIALFGMLMAPLAALAAALPWLSQWGIGGIGYAPAFIALCLYALLPVVANTVLGLESVDVAVVDAARGMGLTEAQILTRIRGPLALPTIVTGIRVVLVQNIGLTAIAALVGGGGLGAFIFQGIGQTAIDLVLLGALPTVAMALVAGVLLDALVEWLDRGRRA